MEGNCSTGQSPQWAVVPVEEEKEKEKEKRKGKEKKKKKKIDEDNWGLHFVALLINMCADCRATS